ncbi:hypothetical protein J2I47_02565 [Fibrella sp. HMF5335]|uniref:Outer membrane protein beta-barrel domain-containing protein n=1 Tax=Fibrella rubiginis TaxID=2817060 RepID=A0A939JZV0_9BACT|nr:hypothetical protein [Fibrella rubiginis]MBO0935422.1 hypothetical protein [Fibrella rubiginis]
MKMLLPFLFLTTCLSPTLAQTGRVTGGAGFFRMGYASLHRVGQTLDQFSSTGQYGLSNDFICIGGEGYARLNKYILGGGGFGMMAHGMGSPTYHAEPFGGGGYLYAGRLVVDTHRFWLYPTAGAGLTVIGLTQRQQIGTSTQESSVTLPNVALQVGVGADWMPVAFGEGDGYGGLLLGMRAGYQISPSSSGWQSTGDVPSDRPRYATNGFFVTMTIGVGGFRYAQPKRVIY